MASSSRRLTGWILIAILALAALWWWRRSGRPTAMPPPPIPVAVATVATGAMPVFDQGLGTVTPLATVTVRAQIAGQLQRIGFAEGQMVRQGDFLAQIDPRPYQALLGQARGQLAHDEALLAQARTDAQRYARLQRQDSIASQQAADQQFLVAQYQGSIASDQAAIDAQMTNLSYCRIVAPISGRVGLRQVDAGNYVTAGDVNGLVVITQLQPISVIFSLPEDDLPPVQQALSRHQALAVSARDRADAAVVGEGALETLDNQIDVTTGTAKLRAIFDNRDAALFPNQFVNARLLVRIWSGVLVPNTALQTGVPGDFVYVLAPDHHVSVRPVRLGPGNDAQTGVLAGLAAGEIVVVDGADRLRDRALVQIGTPSGPPASGAARAGRHSG